MKVVALDRTRITTLDTGVFASLDNQVDTTTGTVRAKARFANSKLNLFPSQFVNVQLQVKTIDDAVVVPVTALRLGGSGDYVYVLNADRTVSLRPVQRGQATAEKIVITSGLKAGERVITEGADRLKDGASVVLPGDAPGAGAGRAAGAAAPAHRAAVLPRQGVTVRHPTPLRLRRPSAGASAASGLPPPQRAALQPNAAPPSIAGPTAEQRQRMLDQVKDDPAALERRKRFLEQIDKGDPAALARWQGMRDNRRQGERPAQ
jgi:multidrug efflux system membrane fusion protein